LQGEENKEQEEKEDKQEELLLQHMSMEAEIGELKSKIS